MIQLKQLELLLYCSLQYSIINRRNCAFYSLKIAIPAITYRWNNYLQKNDERRYEYE